MADAVIFLIPLVLIVLAIILLRRAGRKREALGMPAGETVYQDTREKRGTLLYSERFRVKGKPDFLIRQGDVIIPVEAKTGRTPRQPYQGHIMQLIVYCVLVEENYGIRPPHGIIRYPEKQFEIPFTREQEAALASILEAIRQKRQYDDVRRDHNNLRICSACGYRDRCVDRLA